MGDRSGWSDLPWKTASEGANRVLQEGEIEMRACVLVWVGVG